MVLVGRLSNFRQWCADVDQNSVRPRRSLYVENQRRLKKGEIQQLVADYLNGAGTTRLAEEYGVHRTTIWTHLESAGVPRRAQQRKLTGDEIQVAIGRYQGGESLAAVSTLR